MSIKDWDAQHREAPKVPRHELPCLSHLDAETRFFLTMYLRGASEADQDIAKARCATYGIDYSQAHAEAQRY